MDIIIIVYKAVAVPTITRLLTFAGSGPSYLSDLRPRYGVVTVVGSGEGIARGLKTRLF